jgi:hypothetical protein
LFSVYIVDLREAFGSDSETEEPASSLFLGNGHMMCVLSLVERLLVEFCSLDVLRTQYLFYESVMVAVDTYVKDQKSSRLFIIYYRMLSFYD